MADGTTADGAGGMSVRRHFDVGELLNDGSNGFDVARFVASSVQLALSNCRTFNEVHDNIPLLLAREAKINVGDAEDARRVGVHNASNVSLRSALASDARVVTIFDPESRLACDVNAYAVPVENQP